MNSIQLINTNLAVGTSIVNNTYSTIGNIGITIIAIIFLLIIVYKFFTPQKLPSVSAKIISCICRTRNFDHNNNSILMHRCKMTLIYSIDNKQYKTDIEVDSSINYAGKKDIEIVYNPKNPHDIKMKMLQTRNWIQMISTVSIIISTISLSIWWFTHLKDVGKHIYHKFSPKHINGSK